MALLEYPRGKQTESTHDIHKFFMMLSLVNSYPSNFNKVS